MKRRNKCANKKAYAYRSKAVLVASFWYKYHGIEYGIYECPTCLDFHLTSKYCNLKHRHRRWLIALNKEIEREFNLMCFNLNETNRKIDRAFKAKKKSRSKKLQKESKVAIARKQSILPLAKQREILASLDNKSYPQPRSWWSKIIDIIKRREVSSQPLSTSVDS